MRKIIVIFLLHFCFVIGTYQVVAQPTREKLAEVQVPLKLQTFFYEKFNEIKEEQWAKVIDEKEIYYEVGFVKEGNIYSVLMSKNGFLAQECVLDQKPQLPNQIKFHIDLNYSKFKIVGINQCKSFKREGLENDLICYELQGLNRKEKISIWFDENYEVTEVAQLKGFIVVPEE